MNTNRLKLSVNIFCALTALILALFYQLLRKGFDDSLDNSIVNLLNVLGVSLFILLLADNLKRLAQSIDVNLKETWVTSDAFVTLCGFSIVVLSGFLLPFTGINVLPLFVAAGVIFGGLSLLEYIRQTKFRKFLVVSLIGLPFVVWLGGELVSDPLNPLFFEDLFIGQVDKDTVFHVLLSAMIQTYNIPSTGLNGIPFITYHIGSHWIFAQFSNLFKIHPITIYQMAIPIIIVPLYIKSLLLLVINIRKYFVSPESTYNFRSNILFWCIFFISQIGFLPYDLLGVTPLSHLTIIAPSYIVSLLLSYMAISICLAAWYEYDEEKIVKYKFGLLLFLIPTMIGIIAISKISIGFLMLGLLGYMIVRLALYNQYIVVLGYIIAASVFIAIYAVFFSSLFGVKMYSTSFDPFAFHFYQYIASMFHIKIRWLIYIVFPLAHYSMAILFIVLKLRSAGIISLNSLKENILQKSLLDVEAILFLLIVGSLPGLLFVMPPGTPIYFSDFQQHIAAILLIAYLPIFLSSDIVDRLFSLKSIFRGKMLRYFVSFIFLFIIASVFYNVTRALIYGAGKNIRNRGYMIMETKKDSNPIDSLFKAVKNVDVKNITSVISLLYSSAPQDALKQSKKYVLMQALQRLNKIPLSEKKKSLVFIPQNDLIYWNFLSAHPVYDRISAFLVGTVSGIGMIDGMPPVGSLPGGEKTLTGYPSYKLREISQTKEDCEIDNLCKKVREKGFSKLILINSTDGNIRVIDCKSERNGDNTQKSSVLHMN